VYPVVPPLAVTDADPSFPPLHKIFVDAGIEEVRSVGSVIETGVVVVQPFASVTVTV